MPGPPPKPKDQRVRRNKRPEIGLLPARDAEAFIPKAPPGLLKKTRDVWDAYWRSSVSNAVDPDADAHRIRRWIMAVDEYERCLDVYRKGRLVRGSMGQPVLNPLAAQLNTLEGQIARAELELGLTPMARLRLGIEIGRAQLTAADLNKLLDEQQVTEPEISEPRILENTWESDWEAG